MLSFPCSLIDNRRSKRVHAYGYKSDHTPISHFFSMQGVFLQLSRKSQSLLNGRVVKSVRPLFQQGILRSSLSNTCRFISHASGQKAEEVKPMYEKMCAFLKGAAFSLGGLTLAGFMGYSSDPRDSQTMRDLRSQLDKIRKNYPSVRSFPVV